MTTKTYTRIEISTTLTKAGEEPVRLFGFLVLIDDDERLRHLSDIHRKLEFELMDEIRQRGGPWGMCIGPLIIREYPMPYLPFNPNEGKIQAGAPIPHDGENVT